MAFLQYPNYDLNVFQNIGIRKLAFFMNSKILTRYVLNRAFMY